MIDPNLFDGEPLELRKNWYDRARVRDFTIGALLSLVIGVPWLLGAFILFVWAMDSYCE